MDITQYARLYGTQAVLILALFAIVAGIALAVITARTQAGAQRRRALKITGVVAVMLIGASITVNVALTPTLSAVRLDGVEWNPFAGLADRSVVAYSQLLGNLFMLSWVGLCVPALWRRLRWVAVVGVVLGMSVLIETAQFAVVAGRVASTQDLILNLLGGAVAAAVGVKFIRPWVEGYEDQ